MKNELASPEGSVLNRRKIAVSLTTDQIKALSFGDKLNFDVFDADGRKVGKSMKVVQVTPLREDYTFVSIEGTTDITQGRGGNLVTLEIDLQDPQANEVLF